MFGLAGGDHEHVVYVAECEVQTPENNVHESLEGITLYSKSLKGVITAAFSRSSGVIEIWW